MEILKILNTTKDTEDLAAMLAKYTVVGDIFKLEGDLGVGKTTFARAFIRAFGEKEANVPSPTFTLVQTYDKTRIPVAHVDCYRFKSPEELNELDITPFFQNGVTLLEWAEKAKGVIPEITPPKVHIMEVEMPDSLTLHFIGNEDNGRNVTLTATGSWSRRLGLLDSSTSRPSTDSGRAKFLRDIGYRGSVPTPLFQDCSMRSYYRVKTPDGLRVLMDAPPPMEDIRPFIKVAGYYRRMGVHVPQIYQKNEEEGYMLLEDFGDTTFHQGFEMGKNVEPWMEKAVDLLSQVANAPLAPLREFDFSCVWNEVSRYIDWYLPYVLGKSTFTAERRIFKDLWAQAYAKIVNVPRTTVHWDYHVGNLMMLSKEPTEGLHNVGLIDFQDARLGPCTFDLACLLEDRYPLPQEMKDKLINRFIESLDDEVNRDDFMASYHLVTLQRFLKITGLLVRLEQRDGRVGAMARMEAVWQTIDKMLDHPACAEIKQFINRTAPVSRGL